MARGGQPAIHRRYEWHVKDSRMDIKSFLEAELLILFPFFARILMTQPVTPFPTFATLKYAAQVKTASPDTATRLLGGGDLGLLVAAGTTLAAGEVVASLAGDLLGSLLDDLSTLGEDHLDVAGVGHVRVDLRVTLVEVLLASQGAVQLTRPWAR